MIGIALVGVACYVGWNLQQEAAARAEAEKAAIEVKRATGELQSLHSLWVDSSTLASSTPRIGLAAPVATLQGMRQKAQALNVPECLQPSKEHLVSAMNAGIDSLLIFMRNESGTDSLVGARAATMTQELASYEAKLNACPRPT